MYENLTILAASVFLYSLVSGGLKRTPFHGAVLFTACGLALGPLGLNLLKLDLSADDLRILAELTLALVLFTDASNARLGILKKNIKIPQRLLLIGLPLTILLGFGIGHLLFNGLSLLEVAILATILAPTDAALGKAVVTNKGVPINIREALNVESGLNDGICVPILFVFLALATHAGGQGGTSVLAVKLIGQEIGIGIGVGIGLTFTGVKLIKLFGDRGWITESWHQLPVPALAVACFALTQWLGGSGFIACFIGGLLFGKLEKGHKHKLLLAAEGTGDTLALITWVVFGTIVIGHSFHSLTWQVLLYSLLSLTLIRMLPIFLVLTGLRLQTKERLFIGWFGPRGMASIVFAVIVLQSHLTGGDTITITVVCTIVMSIIAHGLSANPLIAALGARLKHSQKTSKL